MLVNLVLEVRQAVDILSANPFLKGVGIAVVGCMATCAINDRSGAVGAGLGNRGDNGGFGPWRSEGGVGDICKPLVGIGWW